MEAEQQLNLREITTDHPLKICFVCLGNICRSPTAEGVFQHIVKRKGLSLYFEIDSAGTGAYHVGEPANSNSRRIAGQNGVTLSSRARQFVYPDFQYYDLIVAMDSDNLHDLQSLDRKNQFHDKLYLLRSFDPVPEDKEVPDPYYGGIYGFERVFDIAMRSSEEFLTNIIPYIKK